MNSEEFPTKVGTLNDDSNEAFEKASRRRIRMTRSKHLISRRDTLRLIGAAGATAVVAWSGEPAMRFLAPGKRGSVVSAQSLSCIVRPQLTEGPYFVDERLNRSDIRTDPTTGAVKDGVPFLLKFNVSRSTGGSCSRLSGAYVDIWHCDAAGSYSDVRDAGFDTRGQRYLRGYQVTDGSGLAQFQTIYPGWYSGRAVHLHFKIRLFTGSEAAYEFTSQLFFDDAVSDQVFTQSPYNTKGIRNTRNSQDGIYNGGGSQLVLNLTGDAQGYSATFDIALEGVTVAPVSPPEITGATVTGKQLLVAGLNFDTSAVLFMNGEKQKKTFNDESNPTTILIARKSGKLISSGQTVTLQIKNSDNSLSNEFLFTRAVE
jgi:protocatechuate 3,4-dioxygenase beta subunit